MVEWDEPFGGRAIVVRRMNIRIWRAAFGAVVGGGANVISALGAQAPAGATPAASAEQPGGEYPANGVQAAKWVQPPHKRAGREQERQRRERPIRDRFQRPDLVDGTASQER